MTACGWEWSNYKPDFLSDRDMPIGEKKLNMYILYGAPMHLLLIFFSLF